MVLNRSVAMMRGFGAATTTTTTTESPYNGRFEVLSVPIFKKSHSRGSSVGDKIQAIPFRTSAAFLSSLGANLRIADDDLLPSPAGTPLLRPTYDLHQNFPPPSPLPGSILPIDDEVESSHASSVDGDTESSASYRGLTTEFATSNDDIVAALNLVAESVTQQRSMAARVLVLHPLSLSIFTLLITALLHFMLRPGLYGKLVLTTTGLVILTCAFVRQVTLGYVSASEDFSKMWLVDDQMLVSKYGGAVVGALVFGWEKGEGRGNRRKKWGRGIIRAWTVKQKYRGKGIGMELLEDAIKETAKRGGEEIVFADDHANSKLPPLRFCQAPFFRKQQQYKDLLEDLSKTRLGRGRR